jgi:hypothetical protein
MIAPAGVPVSLIALFDGANPARVAMSLYDDSGASPSLISGPLLMTPVVGNAYRSKVTFANGKTYIAFMGVYTDGTFTVLDPSFTDQEQAFSISAQYLTPPVQDVVGLVDCGGNT